MLQADRSYGARQVDGSLAGVEIEGGRTEASPVGDGEPGDVDPDVRARAALAAIVLMMARPVKSPAKHVRRRRRAPKKRWSGLGARKFAPPGCRCGDPPRARRSASPHSISRPRKPPGRLT